MRWAIRWTIQHYFKFYSLLQTEFLHILSSESNLKPVICQFKHRMHVAISCRNYINLERVTAWSGEHGFWDVLSVYWKLHWLIELIISTADSFILELQLLKKDFFSFCQIWLHSESCIAYKLSKQFYVTPKSSLCYGQVARVALSIQICLCRRYSIIWLILVKNSK